MSDNSNKKFKIKSAKKMRDLMTEYYMRSLSFRALVHNKM